MEEQDKLQKELSEWSPWLHTLPRDSTALRTPEGYFEGLEEAIFQKIEAQGVPRRGAPPRSARRLLLHPYVLLAAAASLALLLAALWWGWNARMSPLPAVEYAQETPLSAEELEGYMLDNIQEFEPTQLADLALADSPEATETEPKSTTDPAKKPSLSPEDLDQVLEDMSDAELESLL